MVSKRIINNTCKILNFNYTDTLERAYKVPAENILYIHGKALSSKKLVVGHHDIYNTIIQSEKTNKRRGKRCGAFLFFYLEENLEKKEGEKSHVS